MSKITYQPATRASVRHIAQRLRSADFEEYVMATGRNPVFHLVDAAMDCPGATVALKDGTPIAVLGCYDASPWLLGTDGIEGLAAGKALLRDGSLAMEQWAAEQGPLSHYAYAANTLHIRYLEALGCRVDPPAPRGPFNADFRRFTYE
jgi:hypothetical protein